MGYFINFFAVLRIKSRALCMPSKCFTTELNLCLLLANFIYSWKAPTPSGLRCCEFHFLRSRLQCHSAPLAAVDRVLACYWNVWKHGGLYPTPRLLKFKGDSREHACDFWNYLGILPSLFPQRVRRGGQGHVEGLSLGNPFRMGTLQLLCLLSQLPQCMWGVLKLGAAVFNEVFLYVTKRHWGSEVWAFGHFVLSRFLSYIQYTR